MSEISVWGVSVIEAPPPQKKKKHGYLPPPPPYWLPGIFVYLWVPKIAYISGAWFDLTGCKRFSAGNVSDKWQVCMRIEANDLLLRVFLVFLPKACNLFATIPLNLLSFFPAMHRGQGSLLEQDSSVQRWNGEESRASVSISLLQCCIDQSADRFDSSTRKKRNS